MSLETAELIRVNIYTFKITVYIITHENTINEAISVVLWKK